MAPDFPWELLLTNSRTFFQTMPDGAMILKFAPLAPTPAGLMPMPPAIVVYFSARGWERFQKEVAVGAKLPDVTLPPGVHLPGA